MSVSLLLLLTCLTHAAGHENSFHAGVGVVPTARHTRATRGHVSLDVYKRLPIDEKLRDLDILFCRDTTISDRHIISKLVLYNNGGVRQHHFPYNALAFIGGARQHLYNTYSAVTTVSVESYLCILSVFVRDSLPARHVKSKSIDLSCALFLG